MGSFAIRANGFRPAFGPIRSGLIDAAPSTTLRVLEPGQDSSVTDIEHSMSSREKPYPEFRSGQGLHPCLWAQTSGEPR